MRQPRQAQQKRADRQQRLCHIHGPLPCAGRRNLVHHEGLPGEASAQPKQNTGKENEHGRACDDVDKSLRAWRKPIVDDVDTHELTTLQCPGAAEKDVCGEKPAAEVIDPSPGRSEKASRKHLDDDQRRYEEGQERDSLANRLDGSIDQVDHTVQHRCLRTVILQLDCHIWL